MEKDILIVIPARGGSKGLPDKNIRLLQGKALIDYSIDIARGIVSDGDICISTDSEIIKATAEEYGLVVPFLRPSNLGTDIASTNDVLVHAINFYKEKGVVYKRLLLLQPTSPLRRLEEVKDAISIYKEDCDMVVSVTKSHAPSVLCMDDEDGYVNLVYNKKAISRQGVPTMYEYNGAIYVINIEALLSKGLSGFDKNIKYVMSKESSVDIDDIYDFYLAESILKNK